MVNNISPDRFYICLPYTLAQECPYPKDWNNPKNYSDDPGDSGGPTMCGITHIDYDAYRKSKGLPIQDVRRMSEAEGEEIYETRYWNPECPKLPAGLDLMFFDTAVNMGTSRAVRLLQASLGIAADGDWGPLTQAAVDGISDVAAIIRDEEARRAATYRSFGAFRLFGPDWIRRDQEIAAAALKMVTA